MKKTVEGLEYEFNEVMLPLAEIADEEEKSELTKELLNYVAKVLAYFPNFCYPYPQCLKYPLQSFGVKYCGDCSKKESN